MAQLEYETPPQPNYKPSPSPWRFVPTGLCGIVMVAARFYFWDYDGRYIAAMAGFGVAFCMLGIAGVISPRFAVSHRPEYGPAAPGHRAGVMALLFTGVVFGLLLHFAIRHGLLDGLRP